MIQSMTGYGKSQLEVGGKSFTVEIKSLNSKNLDANVRIPSEFRELELPIRNKLSQSLSRGKVDFSLQVEKHEEESSAKINTKVVESYLKQLQQFPSSLVGDDNRLLQIAMSMPNALSSEKNELEKEDSETVYRVLDLALEQINTFRTDEGQVLKADFELRIQNLTDLLSEVKSIDPERIEHVKTRLRKGIEDLKENIDENRFEQELIYYIEKYDITEEKTRLDNHLSYFIKALNSPDSNGKKLNFICQEIGREINTIGSKSNFAAMQKVVVQMKDELEKIKEQLLNVL
ncbi:YicC family protein [Psychroflexus sp. YR1-1]|uniref:YicC family protein n=1 Tax=Psychroflexus aurantiacus TaxID=2709310 RepID=A0A6B3QXM9_9FLAO|nr:YicC/YloC family endoribonuclease [Psychroflexus aurantiacus]NEV92799.1 YicC family protein [Psychroflexus aurantiacus]